MEARYAPNYNDHIITYLRICSQVLRFLGRDAFDSVNSTAGCCHWTVPIQMYEHSYSSYFDEGERVPRTMLGAWRWRGGVWPGTSLPHNVYLAKRTHPRCLVPRHFCLRTRRVTKHSRRKTTAFAATCTPHEYS